MKIYSKIPQLCALVLAVMVLISSKSYTIDFHYCQGQLKSFSILGEAKNCHEMASKMPSCHHKKNNLENSRSCAEEDNNCCNNELVHVESDFNKQILNIDYLNLDYKFFVGANTNFSFNDLLGGIVDKSPFARYKPPLIQKDIPVLLRNSYYRLTWSGW